MANVFHSPFSNSKIGQYLQDKIWKNSEIGPVENWPTSLIFSLNLILQNPLPQCLLWGKQQLFFFNQAFIDTKLLKDQTLNILGTPFHTEYLKIKADLNPIISSTFTSKTAETLKYETVKLQERKTYWSFYLSPLTLDGEKTEGVLMYCQDNTEQHQDTKQVQRLTNQFTNIIKQAPLGVLIISAETKTVEIINCKFKNLLHTNTDKLLGEPFEKALPKTKFNFRTEISKSLLTGSNFEAYDIPIKIKGQTKSNIRYFNFLGAPIKDQDNSISGLILATTDVTESVIAKQHVKESEDKFKKVILHSPVPIAVFSGPDHIIKLANKTMLQDIWRLDEKTVINKPLIHVFPELKGQKYPKLLDLVYNTGVPYNEKESVAEIMGNNGMQTFYFDFDYSPIFEADHSVSGIIVTSIDVTAKVTSRQQIEKAETRLRIATEAADLATWEVSLQTDAITYSKKLATIMGYPEDSVLTHDALKAHIDKDDLKNILDKALKKALKTGSYFYEVRANKTDNSQIWIRTHGKVFYDDDGIPQKMIGTLRDITAEKKQQQELLESEQKFRLLADSMPQKIWIGNADGSIIYFNKTIYDYTGETPETLMPDLWISIIHPDDREENIRLWKQAVLTGNDYLFEHRFKRYDGQYRWQLSRAIPQRDEQGNIQSWVGTSTDIQDQKMFLKELEKQVKERTKLLAEANLKLKNSVEELQRMNEELESFAYISSHDLQEPLRKIQIFSSRIIESEKENLSENGLGYFDRMQRSANRMQVLIKDLLTYSRTNTSARTFEKTNLNTILNEVKIDLKELLEDKNATLEIGNLCTVYIIPFQFIQLLNNLINNSIKFSRNGIAPIIKIESETQKGVQFNRQELIDDIAYCHIKITDNGIGFEPKYTEKIFDVFERLHNRTAYEGTGIGLAIVKKIIENHNGFIFADSKINEGATFNIYFPANEIPC